MTRGDNHRAPSEDVVALHELVAVELAARISNEKTVRNRSPEALDRQRQAVDDLSARSAEIQEFEQVA